jgi:hypothetical protein
MRTPKTKEIEPSNEFYVNDGFVSKFHKWENYFHKKILFIKFLLGSKFKPWQLKVKPSQRDVKRATK